MRHIYLHSLSIVCRDHHYMNWGAVLPSVLSDQEPAVTLSSDPSPPVTTLVCHMSSCVNLLQGQKINFSTCRNWPLTFFCPHTSMHKIILSSRNCPHVSIKKSIIKNIYMIQFFFCIVNIEILYFDKLYIFMSIGSFHFWFYNSDLFCNIFRLSFVNHLILICHHNYKFLVTAATPERDFQ